MQRSDKNMNKLPTFSYFQDRKIPTFSYFGMKIPTFSYFFDLSYHFQPCTCLKNFIFVIKLAMTVHVILNLPTTFSLLLLTCCLGIIGIHEWESSPCRLNYFLAYPHYKSHYPKVLLLFLTCNIAITKRKHNLHSTMQVILITSSLLKGSQGNYP